MSASNVFVRYVINRKNRNLSTNIVFVGATGSAKSYSSLRFAQAVARELGYEFPHQHIVFTVEDLLALLTSGTLVKGAPILFDEVGIEGNSRAFMSNLNRTLNFVFQSVRSYNNPTILLTCPYASFLDAGVRKLMHGEWHCMGVDKNKNKSKVKPFMLQISHSEGKAYRKYLRILDKNSMTMKPVKALYFSLPEEPCRTDYEKKKFAFQDALYKKLYNDISASKQKENGEEAKHGAAITTRQEEFVAQIRSGKNLIQAAEAMGTTQGNLTKMKKTMTKHGWRFKHIKHGAATKGYEVIPPVGGYV